MFEHNFNGRYSNILEDVLEELGVDKVLREEFEDDYQGFVDVDVLLKDRRIFSLCYSYGSCSGCDEWESRELTDEEIEKEMLNDATFFDNIEQYNEWIKQKKR